MPYPTGSYAFEGVDGAKLHEVHTTFRAALFSALGQNPRWSSSLGVATELPTTGNLAKVKFLERTFGVHEWVDDRQIAKFQAFDHEIAVKRWANAVGIDLDDLDDDKLNLGLYAPTIAEMGDDFAEHRHQLIIDLITSGFAGTRGLAYDGQFFFDTDHPLMGTTSVQSNKGTAVFSSTALYAAIQAMVKIKKPNGQFANVQPTHGFFPEALRSAVEAVLDKQFEANGSNNLLYKRITPIFDPRLDVVSSTAWFLGDMSKATKPFFQVTRKAVTSDMDTSKAFNDGKVYWGANARYNAAYGIYQLMYGSDGTV